MVSTENRKSQLSTNCQ